MKKILRVALTILLIIVIVHVGAFIFVALDVIIPDEFTYVVNDDQNTCTIIGTKNTNSLSIVVPEEIDGYTVTKIASWAFKEHKGVSVFLPETIEYIGEGAFAFCENLVGISGLEKCTNLKEIQQQTFRGCHRLNDISLPEGLEKIGKIAFISCYRLSSINIPSTVTIIDDGAFAINYSMTEIKIPASVEYIGTEAFEACMYLKSIEVEAQNANYCSVDGVLYSKDMTMIHTYPCDKAGSEFTIPDSVTTIPVSTFTYPRNLEILNIPTSVKTIEKDAIKDTKNIATLSKINYNGTIEMWNAISRDPDWAWRYLPDYTIYCTDGKLSKDGTVTYH